VDDQSPGPGGDPAPDSPSESGLDPKPATPSPAWSPDRRTGSWFDWFFRDRQTRHITVAQFPNIPLWIVFATVVLRWVVPTATAARSAIDWTGLAALSWWALDEVLRGVNPWRRLLGLGGCAFAAAGLASLLR
jgi:hypothetical protein